MKSSEWKTYRTRFLVQAKPLSSSLTFIDPLGRQHSGRKGDYLVESDGMLRIAPRQIFEDIYVNISPREARKSDGAKNKKKQAARHYHEEVFSPASEVSHHSDQVSQARRKPVQKISHLAPGGPPLRRKLPQPSRDRLPGSGLGIM